MRKNTGSRKNGSTLVLTLVLLTVSCLMIGALARLTSTASKNLRLTTARERAFYLADSGLRCAMSQMLDDRSGVISLADSRSFFDDTTIFGDSDGGSGVSSMSGGGNWGFKTTLENVSGRTNRLISTGYYDGIEQGSEVYCVDTADDVILNFIYRLVIYSGKEGGLLQVGGSGDSADFVNGDVYVRGNIDLDGDARLRYGELDENDDGRREQSETWKEAYAASPLGPMTQAEFDAYSSSVSQYSDLFYNNDKYDPGEAFVDNIGNGVYDENEAFTDLNGDGEYTDGDTLIVDNGNGVWDEGEAWVEGSQSYRHWRYGKMTRNNGRYDTAGHCWFRYRGYWYNLNWSVFSDWPAEAFEDESDSIYTEPEPFVDSNGVYDEGEEYLDDRNGSFDWGTMASGAITGMGYIDEALGLRDAWGGNDVITSPDLGRMYYERSKTDSTPAFASEGWGHDIAVTASDYSSNGHVINSTSQAEHIFVRNVPDNDPARGNDYLPRETYDGVTVRSRGYELVYDNDGDRIDDYFLEDPTDSYYASYDSGNSIDGTSKTSPSYINVKPEHNGKVYYVDGNVYLHGTPTWAYRFKEPGTRITIVANGNITISDEFYYNADYDEDLDADDIDSTIVKNASDALCLIALKNPECTNNSGNIYIGDPAKGTGGSIHAMMYAENDFIDNNLGGSGQAYISIYGNMAAGGELAIHRDAWDWTRLDVTLDTRLSRGDIFVTGLPPAPAGTVFLGSDGIPDWEFMLGTWQSTSRIVIFE